MRRLGSVQQKIPCVFLTEVKEEKSRKREFQPFQVVATENLNPVALEADVYSAFATEKLDGTCCYVTDYKGHPYLWARLDRKPNKQAEKRFKKYQHAHRSCKGFTWNVEDDFKMVPETWIPAHRVKHHNSHPVPDEHGHIPGWVPVEKDNKQYCWHSSVVDYEFGAALILRPKDGDEALLEIAAVPLAELNEQTLELIGTSINGNPYAFTVKPVVEGCSVGEVQNSCVQSMDTHKQLLGHLSACPLPPAAGGGLGSKKQPIHCLVSHGSIRIRDPPAVDFQQLCTWFQENPEGRVEGIVWHCADGALVKVHRHHLGLTWPEKETRFGERPVVIRVEGTSEEFNLSKDLFTSFSRLNGLRFSRIQDVQFNPERILHFDHPDVSPEIP